MKARSLLGAVAVLLVTAAPAHADITDLLNQVTIAAPTTEPGYERGCRPGQACSFGPAWQVAGQGCDTRNRILTAQLQDVQYKPGTHDCKVNAGWENDPYTGQRIDVHEVQIDHVYPLKAAWNAGANQWPQEERQRFANDTTNLLAVSAHANESKGDRTLSEWLPPNPAEHCPYTTIYLTVAAAYHLPISAADKTAAEQACP